MARKQLFNITEADNGRKEYKPPVLVEKPSIQPGENLATATTNAVVSTVKRRQEYREGKRAVMFFLREDAFSQMHVLLARQGRKKVQTLMEELVDDWFRRENAPRLTK